MVSFPLLSSLGSFFATAIGLPLAEMSGKAISLAWAIVLFCIILGLLVTLSPSRRTSEIKRPKEE